MLHLPWLHVKQNGCSKTKTETLHTASSTFVFSCTATHVSFSFSVPFSRHSQTQDQNPIWSFSSLSFSLIRLQPKTLCNGTKHKRSWSHSPMQTSIDLLFSSLLFSSPVTILVSSRLLFSFFRSSQLRRVHARQTEGGEGEAAPI